MKSILVVDDMSIIRDPIAAALRLAGYTTTTAANGREALTAVQAKPADLILLDVLMPEMDGLTFLKHIRRDANLAGIPVILLTAVSDQRVLDVAGKLGVTRFLIKSRFCLQKLIELTRAALLDSDRKSAPAANHATTAPRPAAKTAGSASATPAPANKTISQKPLTPNTPAPAATAAAPSATPNSSEIPVLLTRDESIERATSAVQASALSGVVGQVISLAASPRSDMSQLSQIISRDPMLSARVLQAANSAAYTSNRGIISTIPDAVKRVGCSTIRNIAAALGVVDAMPPLPVNNASEGFNLIRCWQHSFGVAMLCEKLSANADPEHSDIAYLVGLCHDLGEIMFYTQFADEYRQILEYQQKTGKHRHELERHMLGMTHKDLIVTILRKMNLPDAIRLPIEALHDPHGNTNSLLARVLRLANAYTNGMLLASDGGARVIPISKADCRATCKQDDPPTPDIEQTRCEVLGLTGVLTRLSAADEAKMLAPLYRRKEVNIRYARDAAFSKFDPIEACLSSLANITVSEGLPHADDMKNHQGLVISARTSTVAGMTSFEVKKLLDACHDHKPSVLWIIAKEDGTSEAAPIDTNVQRVISPVTLDTIAKFVDAL